MSTWKDCVTAALLGTEKGILPKLPTPLAPVFDTTAGWEREQQFLTQAGAFGLWRQTGWKPPLQPLTVTPAKPEELASISSVSASHLRVMLSGAHRVLLPEWLDEVVRVRRRVPAELLPALLDLTRQEPAIRNRVITAGGQRVHWLASQYPEWSFAASEDPELWETGNRNQRIAILRARRAAAPNEARATIEAVWKEESADLRTAFVKELGSNLSEDDIPFLETALTDRSKEVRREVVDLLARLPSSPFAARMIARATPLLLFKPGKLLSRTSLEVSLPGEPDDGELRDGINPKDFGYQKVLGEKAVRLLLIIAAVPLQHWTDTFQQPPAALLKAVEKSEFARAVATGWAWASLRQHNPAWAEAIMDGPVEILPELLSLESLFEVLPEPERIERIRASLCAGALQKGDADAWQSLHLQLRSLTGHWSVPLAREILNVLRSAPDPGASAWPWHSILQLLPFRLPPSLLSEATEGWPDDRHQVSSLIETLTFRHAAHSALSES